MKKGQPTDKLQTNILGMLVVVVGLGLVVYYLVAAISAGDPLWFSKDFTDLPVRIIVYQDGRATELAPGQAGFPTLGEGIRASLASGVPRTSGLGLSEASLEDARQQYVTVEAFFSHPVQLHAAFRTGQATQMLFPITGRHSDRNVVFLCATGTYFAGAPILNTTQPLRDALKTLGYKTE